MIPYELARLAEEELSEAAAFYAKRWRGLGISFLNDFENCIGLIRRNPEIGAPYRRDTRRLPLQGFPYNIIYHTDRTAIFVIAIAHHRRKPDYWVDRFP